MVQMSDPLIVVAVIGLFAAPAAAMITWWLNRGKDKMQSAVSLIAASGEAVDAIHDVMTALHADMARTKADMIELRDQNVLLREQNEQLRYQNEQLIEANKQLLTGVNDLRDQIRVAFETRLHPNDFWDLISKLPGVRDGMD